MTNRLLGKQVKFFSLKMSILKKKCDNPNNGPYSEIKTWLIYNVVSNICRICSAVQGFYKNWSHWKQGCNVSISFHTIHCLVFKIVKVITLWRQKETRWIEQPVWSTNRPGPRGWHLPRKIAWPPQIYILWVYFMFLYLTCITPYQVK